ncbi:hypothetical protein D3C86_1963780 [compost metagenome]
MNDHYGLVNLSVMRESTQRARKHSFAADPPILFRPLSALSRPFATPRGYDDCCCP